MFDKVEMMQELLVVLNRKLDEALRLGHLPRGMGVCKLCKLACFSTDDSLDAFCPNAVVPILCEGVDDA